MTYQPPEYDPRLHQQRIYDGTTPQPAPDRSWARGQQSPAPGYSQQQYAPRPPQPAPQQTTPQNVAKPRKKRHIAFWTFVAFQLAVIIWMITANLPALFIVATVIVINVVAIKAWSSSGGPAANARLRGYGVVVDGDTVKHAGYVLGPLATAQAEVTQGTSRHTLTRTVTVVGAATKKTNASVIVTTLGGGYHEEKIEGAAELRRAQAWVVKFNAMAVQAAAAQSAS
jgi:hypothetical protein